MVRFSDMGQAIGQLDAATMRVITRQIAVVLGIGVDTAPHWRCGCGSSAARLMSTQAGGGRAVPVGRRAVPPPPSGFWAMTSPRHPCGYPHGPQKDAVPGCPPEHTWPGNPQNAVPKTPCADRPKNAKDRVVCSMDRSVRDAGAGGSNPLTPTNEINLMGRSRRSSCSDERKARYYPAVPPLPNAPRPVATQRKSFDCALVILGRSRQNQCPLEIGALELGCRMPSHRRPLRQSWPKTASPPDLTARSIRHEHAPKPRRARSRHYA